MSKDKHTPADHAQDDRVLPDHDYDGIREEDNSLPKWWVGLFFLLILFSLVYIPVVHVLDILPRGELQRSVALAARVQEQRQLALEASGALDKDPVAAGQKYFKTFCINCHGAYGEGGLCPNLTDAYWIHTPYADSIRMVITNGVAAKGMPTWGPVLGDRKIKCLAAYVGTLYLKPPPVPGKKAEGIEYDLAAIRASEGTKLAVAADTTAKKN
ncbi:MAG TPA: cbb3-type cytochrome c oxidase N-terminal domain-containing protein [bacterium]|jgi:cytochrome c oxidase cbb3-type subunit 3